MLLSLALPSTLSGQGRELDEAQALGSVRALMQTANGTGIWSEYFSIGDVEGFLAQASGWLNGIAVDPEYIRQVESGEGYTQPKGWSGFARSLGDEEWRYAGYIVLRDFDPENNASHVTTLFHETIHAFAFAVGAGGVDEDRYNGPEYISGAFLRFLLPRIKSQEPAFLDLVEQVRGCEHDEREIAAWLTQLQRLNQWTYENGFGHPNVEALLELMGGRADWKGYERRLLQELRLARGERVCEQDAEDDVSPDVFARQLREARLALDSLEIASRELRTRVDSENDERIEFKREHDRLVNRVLARVFPDDAYEAVGLDAGAEEQAKQLTEQIAGDVADARGAGAAFEDIVDRANAVAEAVCRAGEPGAERLAELATLMEAARSQAADAAAALTRRIDGLEPLARGLEDAANYLIDNVAELNEAIQDVKDLEAYVFEWLPIARERRNEVELRISQGDAFSARLHDTFAELEYRAADDLAHEALDALRARFDAVERGRPHRGAVPEGSPILLMDQGYWDGGPGALLRNVDRLRATAAETRGDLEEARSLVVRLSELEGRAEAAVRAVGACVRDLPEEDLPEDERPDEEAEPAAPSGAPPPAELEGLPLEAALARLGEHGPEAVLEVGNAPPSQDAGGTIERAVWDGGRYILQVFPEWFEGSGVPDVRGWELNAAVDRVESAGFAAVLEVWAPASHPDSVHHVAEQVPPGGTEAAAGSDVTLRIWTEEETPSRIVPDVVGMGVDLAESVIAQADLFTTVEEVRDPVGPDRPNTVYRQYPEPGLEVPQGVAIQIWTFGDRARPAQPDRTAFPSSPSGGSSGRGGARRADPGASAPPYIDVPDGVNGVQMYHARSRMQDYDRDFRDEMSTGRAVRPSNSWGAPNHRMRVRYDGPRVWDAFRGENIGLSMVVDLWWWSAGGAAECGRAGFDAEEYGVYATDTGRTETSSRYVASLNDRGKAVYATLGLPAELGVLQSYVAAGEAQRVLEALMAQVADYAASC